MKICFLPPNCTSACQPLDQNIIKKLAKSINILEALYFIHTAWNNVSQATIKNCFAKAGFKKNEGSLPASKGEYEQEAFVNFKYLNLDEAICTEEQCDIDYELPEEREQDMQENDEEKVIITKISSIKSYSEGLKVIEELKMFAQDDFMVFKTIKKYAILFFIFISTFLTSGHTLQADKKAGTNGVRL
ncbi:uncharacterized protein [Euwallacea similis]|uniref:uncharacterized protein n=1 Tax=Euwallacea similis TaxID=1736056 RepID=UPI00344F6297